MAKGGMMLSGFKEMYCDADVEDSSLKQLGSPRRQVYELLTDLIMVWLPHPCLRPNLSF